jgi:hypothetical protein
MKKSNFIYPLGDYAAECSLVDVNMINDGAAALT